MAPNSVINESVGSRLRRARKARQMTLRDLAGAVGCSESLVSKIENGKGNPPLSTLHDLTTALGVSISSLFAEADYPEVAIYSRGQRPRLQASQTVTLEALIPHSDRHLLQAHIHIIAPGGHTEGQYAHEGEEAGFVLAGQLKLVVNEKTYRLSEGDSFSFRSDLVHSYENPGDTETRVLWVNTPATF
jgi:transcriptional regulator with XRE-family HTH domain